MTDSSKKPALDTTAEEREWSLWVVETAAEKFLERGKESTRSKDRIARRSEISALSPPSSFRYVAPATPTGSGRTDYSVPQSVVRDRRFDPLTGQVLSAMRIPGDNDKARDIATEAWVAAVAAKSQPAGYEHDSAAADLLARARVEELTGHALEARRERFANAQASRKTSAVSVEREPSDFPFMDIGTPVIDHTDMPAPGNGATTRSDGAPAAPATPAAPKTAKGGPGLGRAL